MFSAWQNMNHTQASAPKMAPRPDRRPSDGSNMTGSTDGSWTASGTSGTSKNSPYAQAQQNRANPQHNDAFGRRQKHQVSPAFDPSGSGQSSGTPSQSQGASYQAHPGPPPPPRPQPQAGTTRRSDPMRDFRQRSGDEVPFAEGSPRTSSPYASNAGERTYFVSEQLRRSESTRDHTKTYHAQADDPRTGTTGPRRRSDSVQMESTANEVGAGSNRKTTAFTVGSSDEESATSSARPVGDATQQPPGVPTRPLKKPSRTWSRRSETASKGSESRTDNSTASGARRVHHDTDEASMCVIFLNLSLHRIILILLQFPYTRRCGHVQTYGYEVSRSRNCPEYTIHVCLRVTFIPIWVAHPRCFCAKGGRPFANNARWRSTRRSICIPGRSG